MAAGSSKGQIGLLACLAFPDLGWAQVGVGLAPIAGGMLVYFRPTTSPQPQPA